MYIDNFLPVSNSQVLLDWFKGRFKDEYNVKDLGGVKTIIGWYVTWNLDARTLKFD